MSDRVFTIAFAISLGLHLVLLVGQFITLTWFTLSHPRPPLEVIYDYEIAQQELRQLRERLARAKQTTASASSAPLGPRTEVRIPNRPLAGADAHLLDLAPGRSSMIDLTNLVEASQGDPILLTYFSAIREQIQHAANRQTWLEETTDQGLVYISFVLTSTGAIQDAVVVSERSVPRDVLRSAALRIVKAAAPFPPFPSSITEPTKLIVVPLEFLLGS